MCRSFTWFPGGLKPPIDTSPCMKIWSESESCYHARTKAKISSDVMGPKRASVAISQHQIFPWEHAPRPPSFCVHANVHTLQLQVSRANRDALNRARGGGTEIWLGCERLWSSWLFAPSVYVRKRSLGGEWSRLNCSRPQVGSSKGPKPVVVRWLERVLPRRPAIFERRPLFPKETAAYFVITAPPI